MLPPLEHPCYKYLCSVSHIPSMHQLSNVSRSGFQGKCWAVDTKSVHSGRSCQIHPEIPSDH